MSDNTVNKMKYVRLGKSGLKVSNIILGCMSYGSKEWETWVLEEDEALKHIKLAYDLGINAFDTANVYSHGESERILGKAIKKFNLHRDEIVIMTKVNHLVGRTQEFVQYLPEAEKDKQRYANQYGLSRKHIFDSVKHSLERLQLDYIDLLQCHRFDRNTPIEETMQALHDVVKAGYVRYIGMSSCYAWQFYKMQSYAREHGLTEFISMQNLYNPIYREEEREMMPMLKDSGVGVIPWSPLAGGFLARPFNAHKQKETTTTRATDDQFFTTMTDTPEMPLINQRVEEVAKAHNVSMAQVVLAWSLSKEFITAPIYGTTSIDKLKDALGAVSLHLTPEEIKSIDEPYQARGVFPAYL
ncbi:hypothetical protein M407DRAFT_20993 [Tulasnella calospora MUT 4182]|uniref:NADP-dependent oxidoreductase domain-containing protein n=1 Tax=Tulasnella calospora MUT 4182 TaxID=1051891 RepID=A0A0C3QQQ2_9AGAM|nr:hypothetical protein M407DRAFT_20993 [Tulasnella calospora MUT 4182]